MPEMKYYEVRRTQVVQVWANTEIGAAQIAEAAFENGQDGSHLHQGDMPIGVPGNTTTAVEIESLRIDKL